MANIISCLGFVWDNKGDCDKSIEYYEKALAINLSVLGKKHSNTTYCQFEIGEILMQQEEYIKAIKYIKEAFDIDKSNGGYYPFQLGVCYEKIKHYKEALEWFILSANIRKEKVGIDDEATQDSIKTACSLAKKSNNIKLLPAWIKKLK